MSGVSEELSLLCNKFGTISGRDLVFPSKKGLFLKGKTEEIPLKQIVSVHYHRQRSFVTGFAAIIGIVLPFVLHELLSGKFMVRISGITNAVFSGDLVLKIVGSLVVALCLCIAYLNMAGLPTVVITTETGKVSKARGWPWEREEAKGFTLILRECIK